MKSLSDILTSAQSVLTGTAWKSNSHSKIGQLFVDIVNYLGGVEKNQNASSVNFVEQNLSDAQKGQARNNINAASIDAMNAISQGGPRGTYPTAIALNNVNPDHKYTYAVGDATNGFYWYYHNGTTFVQGGLYQAPLGLVSTRSQSTTTVPDSKLLDDELTNIYSYSSELLPLVVGFINASDGLLANDNFGKRTDYIPIKPGTTIIYSGQVSDSTLGIAAYDVNKAYIGSLLKPTAGITNTSVRIADANIKYIAVSGLNGLSVSFSASISLSLPDVKSELNTIITAAQSDVDYLKDYEPLPLVVGFINASDGLLANDNFGKRTDYIPVKPGTTIIYSGQVGSTTSGISAYDGNKTYLRSLFQPITGVSNVSIKIEDADVKYVAVSGLNNLSVNFAASISMSLSDIKSEMDTLSNSVNGNDKVVAVSEYIFPTGQTNVLYINQLSLLNESKLIVKTDSNFFSNLFKTEKTIESYLTSPIASGSMHLSLFKNGLIVDGKDTTFRSVGVNVGDGRKVTICVAGDSLIDTSGTSCELFKLLGIDADYTIKQIGTRIATMDGVNYLNEGRGSWDWAAYLNPLYENTQFAGKTNAFMHNGVLNFTNYLTTNFPGESSIDIFFMLLGTNDVSQGTVFKTDDQIAAIIYNAKVFIDAFTSAFPNSKFIVGLPSIGGDETGSTITSADMFRTSMQKLNLKYIETFDNGAYHHNVSCVHHGAYIDTLNSYNEWDVFSNDYLPDITAKRFGDGIHPLLVGYKQFGRGLYCKCRGLLKDYFTSV